MFDIGSWELFLIFMLLLFVVGPERLPTIAGYLGKWFGKFLIDNKGNPKPFANVGFYEANNEKWFGSNTNEKGEFTIIIFPPFEEGIYSAIVNAGENNRHHEIIYGLKGGDRKSYNFTVSKKPSIKGKVLNLDGRPQYGVVVQALGLNNKGIEDPRHMFTVHTSKNGDFEFNNLPLNFKYNLRIHGEEDFVYYKSNNESKFFRQGESS